jgi:hypothetical protein
MPAILLPHRDNTAPSDESDTSPSHSRRASRLSVQLVRERIRDPIQSLQKLKYKALKRHSQNIDPSVRGFAHYPNSSFRNSLVSLGPGGRNSPRFERKTPGRVHAIQQHRTIEFRQRFLALPVEIRSQIYHEVITGRQGHQSQVSHYQSQTQRFVYTVRRHDLSGSTLVLYSDHPRPDHLHYIREGDHMWQELMDRWLTEAECESSQLFDLGMTGLSDESHENLHSLFPKSTRQSSLGFAARPGTYSLKGLDPIVHRWIRACKLNLNFYGVDFNFSQAAQDAYKSPLYTTLSQIASYLTSVLNTSDLRIKINMWPGEYMESSDHGWDPFFESDADIEGMWSLMKPLKSIPGIQSIRAKRLRGTALWSRHPNSLYPANPPLVVIERAGVSIDGWLDWDEGWRSNWGFGDLLSL